MLFRDGQALKRIEAIGFAGGPEAHRRAQPRDWTSWRRSGGKVEIINAKGEWNALAFGITLVITYHDGSTESRIIVTDPKDAKGAIWLDGVGYSRR